MNSLAGRIGTLDLGELRRPSLVRRLIWLAAIWSLLVLLAAAVALTTFFQRSSLSRFDQSLFEITEGLVAGTTVEGNEVVAPALTDTRATRVYSGRYWEIAQPGGPEGMQWLVRSRSLWDSEVKPPPLGAAGFKPGSAIYYDTVGPVGERLRAGARTVLLPGWAKPVIFIVAEDRGPIDRDSSRFALTTAIALVLLGLGLVAGVILQVRVGLQPLFRLRRDVADVRKGKADSLAVDYPVELSPLAVELNARRIRWPAWSCVRLRSCAIRLITISAAPAPPPVRRGRASAPKWPRCSTSWRARLSAFSWTRASVLTGTPTIA